MYLEQESLGIVFKPSVHSGLHRCLSQPRILKLVNVCGLAVKREHYRVFPREFTDSAPWLRIAIVAVSRN
jgi:hypothetical protein